MQARKHGCHEAWEVVQSGFETYRADIIRSSKKGDQWPYKKAQFPSKTYKDTKAVYFMRNICLY